MHVCVCVSVTGCSRTHSVTLGDWSDPLDPDVETQTVYKQLIQGRDKLRSVDVESGFGSSSLYRRERSLL